MTDSAGRDRHIRLGRQLAACREAAGLSQTQLGRLLGYVRSEISHVEHGRRGPTEARFWEAADQACGAHGELVTAWETVQRREGSYCGCTGEAQTLAMGAQAEDLLTVIERLSRTVSRRVVLELLQLIGWTASAGLIGNIEWTRVAKAIEAPGSTDPETIRHLRTVLTSFQQQESAEGPTQVLHGVLSLDDIVCGLLRYIPERMRAQALLLHSDIAATTGGYLIDLHDHERARQYLCTARIAGQEASALDRVSYALSMTSLGAGLRGDKAVAADAAHAAVGLAVHAEDRSVTALAHSMESGAHSLQFNHKSCVAAYVRAREAIAHGRDSSSPAYWLDTGTVQSGFARSLLQLGRPAVDAAQDALTIYDTSFRASYAGCQARLAQALLLMREVDEAAHTLGAAAEVASEIRSPRVVGEIRTVRGRMQRWQQTRAVSELDTALRAHGLWNSGTRKI